MFESLWDTDEWGLGSPMFFFIFCSCSSMRELMPKCFAGLTDVGLWERESAHFLRGPVGNALASVQPLKTILGFQAARAKTGPNIFGATLVVQLWRIVTAVPSWVQQRLAPAPSLKPCPHSHAIQEYGRQNTRFMGHCSKVCHKLIGCNTGYKSTWCNAGHVPFSGISHMNQRQLPILQVRCQWWGAVSCKGDWFLSVLPPLRWLWTLNIPSVASRL